MKKKIVLTSVFLILLTLISSCDLTPMEEGRSVNEYIFPYVFFTLKEEEDGSSYYEASILDGAKVSSIYIPSYVENNENGNVPVKYFTGFENEEDMVNLKSTTFESSSTEIKLKSLDQASLLYTLKYNTVDSNSTIWRNLPNLPHTEDEEFVGWFLQNNPDVRIYNGSVMVPGYTTLFPKWGTHTFKDVEAKGATCTEPGWEAYHYCTNEGCGYTTKVELPALGHSLIKHEISSPTCVDYGYKTVCWECTRCGAFFSDEEAENTIDKTTVVIPYSGHTSDDTGYHNDETSHWLICSVCKEEYAIEKHTYGEWYLSPEEGYTQERKCKVCGYVDKSKEGHDWKEAGETDSTCTVKGHRAYWYCTNHEGEYSLSDNPIININETELHAAVDKDLLPHTLSGWEKDSEKHWKTCSVCNGIFDEKEHEFEYTFVVDREQRSMTVRRQCIVCGAEYDGSPSENPSAFDITTVFGAIDVTRTAYNTWTLRYKGTASECYWTDEKGNDLIAGPDPFTLSYSSSGKGRIIVYCHEKDDSGREVDVSLVALTTY